MFETGEVCRGFCPGQVDHGTQNYLKTNESSVQENNAKIFR